MSDRKRDVIEDIACAIVLAALAWLCAAVMT
jgi:hypothetical protein